jgi:hypothetical protein
MEPSALGGLPHGVGVEENEFEQALDDARPAIPQHDDVALIELRRVLAGSPISQKNDSRQSSW